MNITGIQSWVVKNHRFLFYSCWIILGIMQASMTELIDDEGYYWAYSRFLDWGYFDHPPLTALLIKMGYSLFPNELGVRLFPLILHILSLFILERLMDRRNPFIFYTIALSIAVLQVMGFVSVPDIPLIFFTALFFLCYRKFLSSASLLNTFLLGLAIALLFYSKYHAVLIVFFTWLSNLKLFVKYQAWLAGFVALILIGPHLWWQYQHDWISFRYHLFESNVSSNYKFSYTTDYVLGQLLMAGPVAGVILLPAALLYKPKTVFERSQQFTLIGIYLFFLVSSFRGRVEANWTAPGIIPFILLSFWFLAEHPRWYRVLFKLLPVTLILVLIFRIAMVIDFIPLLFLKRYYHQWDNWPAEMNKRTHDLPVVFGNSYQRASKYWFYTGRLSYSLNNYKERKNNYNYWPIEDSLLGKPVYLADKYDLWRFPDSIHTPLGWVGYKYDSLFISFAKIKIDPGVKSITTSSHSAITLNCSFEIPEHYTRFIQTHTIPPDTTRIGILNAKGLVKDIFTGITLQQMIDQKMIPVKFVPDLPIGEYYLRFAINSGAHSPTHNSDKIKLIIR